LSEFITIAINRIARLDCPLSSESSSRFSNSDSRGAWTKLDQVLGKNVALQRN